VTIDRPRKAPSGSKHGKQANVRYWPLAENSAALAFVRYWTKADIRSCTAHVRCAPPVEAAKLAGYPQGSQFAASARKRARRQDVKIMVAELQKPMKEKLAREIEANFAWATEKLMSIASAKLDLRNIKASDKIRAIEVLAKMHGWNAPEKTNLSGESKIDALNGSLSNLRIETAAYRILLAKARNRGAFGRVRLSPT
jgi:hypothetical protein